MSCKEDAPYVRARENERQKQVAFAPLIEVETEKRSPGHLFAPSDAGKSNISSNNDLSATPAGK